MSLSKEISVRELQLIEGDIGILGRGKYGVVLLCDHHTLRLTAVKCCAIKGSGRQIARCIEKVNEELSIITKITHPNVVNVCGATKWNCNLGLIMELLPGGSLHDLITEVQHPPFDLRLRLVYDIANGLSCLHTAGEIHSDMKPHNILLTDRLRCKIADFGSERIFRHAGHQTASSQEKNPAQDVFAFGQIVYFILAGSDQPLLAQTDVCAYVEEHLKRVDHGEIPQFLANIAQSALSWRTDDRPSMLTIRDKVYARFAAIAPSRIEQSVDQVLLSYVINPASREHPKCPLIDVLIDNAGQVVADINYADEMSTKLQQVKLANNSSAREHKVEINSSQTGRQNSEAEQQPSRPLKGPLQQSIEDIRKDLREWKTDIILVGCSRLGIRLRRFCDDSTPKTSSDNPAVVINDAILLISQLTESACFVAAVELLTVTAEVADSIKDASVAITCQTQCAKSAAMLATYVNYIEENKLVIETKLLPVLLEIEMRIRRRTINDSKIKQKCMVYCAKYTAECQLKADKRSNALEKLEEGVKLMISTFENPAQNHLYGDCFFALAEYWENSDKGKAETCYLKALQMHQQATDLKSEEEKASWQDYIEYNLIIMYATTNEKLRSVQLLQQLKQRKRTGIHEIINLLKILMCRIPFSNVTREVVGYCAQVHELVDSLQIERQQHLFLNQAAYAPYSQPFTATRLATHISISLSLMESEFSKSFTFLNVALALSQLIPNPNCRMVTVQKLCVRIPAMVRKAREAKAYEEICYIVDPTFDEILLRLTEIKNPNPDVAAQSDAWCRFHFGHYAMQSEIYASARNSFFIAASSIEDRFGSKSARMSFVGKCLMYSALASGKLDDNDSAQKSLENALKVFRSADDWKNDEDRRQHITQTEQLQQSFAVGSLLDELRNLQHHLLLQKLIVDLLS